MSHVSPKPINKDLSKKIYELLIGAITNKSISKKQHGGAFNELLTPTEKVMLGKRLAAVSLLSNNVSPYRVGKVLQLSPTTTLKLQTRLESGKLSNTKRLCSTLKKSPLQLYLENLLKPLPRYGTSPASLFKEKY
ncbi:MAG: hypothetical protein ISR99_00050 [Parcubacteria group bacterium]|nr:hypothetical protein [Parcubacteria group bacterium]